MTRCSREFTTIWNDTIFKINREAEPVKLITDISEYNVQEGLALNQDEIDYLTELSKNLAVRLQTERCSDFPK